MLPLLRPQSAFSPAAYPELEGALVRLAHSHAGVLPAGAQQGLMPSQHAAGCQVDQVDSDRRCLDFDMVVAEALVVQGKAAVRNDS